MVSYYLKSIIPKLEAQNSQNVLFEGVQLTPSIVAPYLTGNNRIVIVTTNAKKIETNRNEKFGGDIEMSARYSTDKLLLLQDEITRQGRDIPEDRIFYVGNTDNYMSTVEDIISYLFTTNVIGKK